VVSDVPVDDEAPLVTSRISRSAGAQSFGGAHSGRVCVCVFIGVSVSACCEYLRCTASISNKRLESHSVGLIFVIRIHNDGEQIKGSGDRMKLRS
jgi:hypothetical protein